MSAPWTVSKLQGLIINISQMERYNPCLHLLCNRNRHALQFQPHRKKGSPSSCACGGPFPKTFGPNTFFFAQGEEGWDRALKLYRLGLYIKLDPIS